MYSFLAELHFAQIFLAEHHLTTLESRNRDSLHTQLFVPSAKTQDFVNPPLSMQGRGLSLQRRTNLTDDSAANWHAADPQPGVFVSSVTEVTLANYRLTPDPHQIRPSDPVYIKGSPKTLVL